MADILIVDDEVKIGKLLVAELGDAGHRASSTNSPLQALERVDANQPDIVITDLRMAEMDGIDLLKRIRTNAPSTDVIIMTAYASIETAITAMKEGAYDYIIKPFRTEELLHLISRIEEKRSLEAENRGLKSYLSKGLEESLVGSSAYMQNIRKLIQDVSHSEASILIRGESGTGKEVVARAIHKTSKRSSGPFIALNCAAIPETLLESELFGYEKGAFTGASRKKLGHFQLANGGTLFLDEIGDLPQPLQAKLLRVLESHAIIPLGGEKESPIDIRLLSATNRALEEEIANGRFREDLFYRLNVFPIVLSPLRDHKEDIRELAQHFLTASGRSAGDLGDDAARALLQYRWPGNIRELKNVIERAMIVRPSGAITADDILLGSTASRERQLEADDLSIEEMERRLVAKALQLSGGNKSEAARLLGITRRVLYGRLEKYGLD
jgi:DNA-binding NtrC family response regulator